MRKKKLEEMVAAARAGKPAGSNIIAPLAKTAAAAENASLLLLMPLAAILRSMWHLLVIGQAFLAVDEKFQ